MNFGFKKDPLKNEIKEAMRIARDVIDYGDRVHLGDFDIYQLSDMYYDIIQNKKNLSKRGNNKYEILIKDLQFVSYNALGAINEIVGSGEYKKSNGFYWECLN